MEVNQEFWKISVVETNFKNIINANFLFNEDYLQEVSSKLFGSKWQLCQYKIFMYGLLN